MAGTFIITSDSVSSTPLDVNVILKTITYTTPALIYEPPQYDANTGWPTEGIFALSDGNHQIFLYDGFTNGAIAPGSAGAYGGGPITFNAPVGALYVRGVPTGATWTIVTEAAPAGTVFPDWSVSSVFDEDPAVAAQRQRDHAILMAERIRTTPPPPTSVELMQAAGIPVVPPLDPPPPDPLLVEARRKTHEQVAAERAARASAKGPTICGRSQAEIETELLFAAQRRLADEAAGAAANAEMYQRAKTVTPSRAAAQAEATALLEKAHG
jgi:hypothetical protein